jgi:twitching motility protein PilT
MSQPKIDNFLTHMIQQGASDLHLATGAPPILRIHGDLRPMQYINLEDQHVRELVMEIAPEHARQSIAEGRSVSFGYGLAVPIRARFRLNVFPERRGLSAAVRHIPGKAPNISDLNIPPIVPEYITGMHGLVVIAGATGSGKSTTMAACVNEINHRDPVHIITLENPIEFLFENERALIHQREIGQHAESFEDAIREAMRQDPDVLVVGEVRTQEEIRRALIAAETGHLVFTTVHASSAEKAIARLISVFPPDEHAMIRTVLSETLRCVVAQKLILNRARDGRRAAIEIMVNTPAVSSLIRENKNHQLVATMQGSSRQGMRTMTEALARLIKNGDVDITDARYQAPYIEELEKLLAKRA